MLFTNSKKKTLPLIVTDHIKKINRQAKDPSLVGNICTPLAFQTIVTLLDAAILSPELGSMTSPTKQGHCTNILSLPPETPIT